MQRSPWPRSVVQSQCPADLRADNVSPFVFNKGRSSCWEKAKRATPQVGEYGVQSFPSSPLTHPGELSAVFVLLRLCLPQHSFSLGSLEIIREALTALLMASRIQLLKNLQSPGEVLYLIQDILDFHSIALSQAWNVRPEIPSFLTERACLPRRFERLQQLLSMPVCLKRRNLK